MRAGLIGLMALGAMGFVALDHQPASARSMPEPVRRKVARLELARSIRAFAAATLANGTCLVESGSLSRSQVDAAMSFALQEVGIHPAVLRNPLVQKTAELLQPRLDTQCGLSGLADSEAKKLVEAEL